LGHEIPKWSFEIGDFDKHLGLSLYFRVSVEMIENLVAIEDVKTLRNTTKTLRIFFCSL
jgi:hypothetical protein